QTGWVVNANQNRLMWVPYDVRDTLLRPWNNAVISHSGSVRLDFSNAKLGEEWGQCFDPKRLSNSSEGVRTDFEDYTAGGFGTANGREQIRWAQRWGAPFPIDLLSADSGRVGRCAQWSHFK
ncbi:hypothetical protein FS749_006233, partial [Ceratobasidium sp. UAMH 11750]